MQTQLKNARILVTGAQGYVGRHVVWELLSQGAQVLAWDRPGKMSRCKFSVGEREVCQGIDLTNEAQVVGQLTAEYKLRPIDGVIHLASLIEVGESMHFPLRYYRENLGSTLALLQAMEQLSIKPIVFASSAATYGNPGDTTINEACTPVQAINPYGQTKVMIEKILSDLAQNEVVAPICLRLFNIAGLGTIASSSWLQAELATVSESSGLIIPLLLKVWSERRELSEAEYARVGVLAKGAPTPDGTVLRDYVHVLDVAQAFRISLESIFRQQNIGESFNIASGNTSSIEDILAQMQAVTDRRFEIQWRTLPAGFPHILKADITKAQQRLGYHPNYSQLQQIILSSSLSQALTRN